MRILTWVFIVLNGVCVVANLIRGAYEFMLINLAVMSVLVFTLQFGRRT